MMNKTKAMATAVLLGAATMVASAREASVASPSGKLTVAVNDEGGRATYAITLEGKPMVLPSALGFKADFGDFTQGLKITSTKAEQVDKCYEMRQAKQSHIHYVATLLTVDFENARQQKMSMQFSVGDNDVAFRYLIPRQRNDNPKSAVVMSEATAFSLPQGTTTFLTPQSKAMVGWERTKPSYEEEYKADAPMDQRSQYGEGYTFPCLFKTPGNSGDSGKSGKSGETEAPGWVLISETGVSTPIAART